jgi:hypothetical protein
VNGAAVLRGGVGKLVKEETAISVHGKDRDAIVPTLYHVLGLVSQRIAWQARHRRLLLSALTRQARGR